MVIHASAPRILPTMSYACTRVAAFCVDKCSVVQDIVCVDPIDRYPEHMYQVLSHHCHSTNSHCVDLGPLGMSFCYVVGTCTHTWDCGVPAARHGDDQFAL